MPGYHLREIKRGEFGEVSKITEEYDEFIESLEQKNPVMALVELSDLIGAIEGYAKRHHNISLEDLLALKNATERAFKSGHRCAKRA